MTELLALLGAVLQVDAARLSDEDGMETMPQWDSLKVLMIASMVEVKYGITLANTDIEQMTSVRAVREVLARHVGAT